MLHLSRKCFKRVIIIIIIIIIIITIYLFW